MLVVVSLVVLLIAMLLPALGRSREMARQAICQSTMRQTHIANEAYADDFEDVYLPIRSAEVAGESGTGAYWMWNAHYRDLLGEDLDTYDMPSVRCASIEPDAIGSGGLKHNSYGWNRTPHSWCEHGIFIHRFRIRTPSSTCQNIDGTDWHITSSYANYTVNWDIYRHTRLWQVAYRHTEGANIQHFDGHIEWYPKQEVWDVDSNAAPTELWVTYERSDPCMTQ